MLGNSYISYSSWMIHTYVTQLKKAFQGWDKGDFLKKILFICLREKEQEQGEGQREMKRESQADRLPSMEPDVKLDPTILRTWPGTKLRELDQLTDWASQAPVGGFLITSLVQEASKGF